MMEIGPSLSYDLDLISITFTADSFQFSFPEYPSSPKSFQEMLCCCDREAEGCAIEMTTSSGMPVNDMITTQPPTSITHVAVAESSHSI